MSIKRIKVTNFKSFKDLDVELGDFNIIIGANASGKSNFINIFRFLRDISTLGLDNAISIQGGVEYLKNINLNYEENLCMQIICDNKYQFSSETKIGLIGLKIYQISYEFEIKFNKKGHGFKVIKDIIKQQYNLHKLEKINKIIEEKENLGNGEITITMLNGNIKKVIKKPNNINLNDEEIYPQILLFNSLLKTMKNSKNEDIILTDLFGKIKERKEYLLLESPLFIFIMPRFENEFNKISIYDFDPKLPKKTTTITGKSKLEEDGNNLSIVLKNIISNTDKKRKFNNLIKELLPFVADINYKKIVDKSLIFTLCEEFNKEEYLFASFLSDGTINIILQIVALYFEDNILSIIEEPERNIHPYLISKLIDMMKDASKNKQLIITTHNPEIIKHSELNDILLLSRDKEGFSNIIRPAEKEEVKIFIKNNIGIEELYVQNLLEM